MEKDSVKPSAIWTKKDVAEEKAIERKVFSGKATRKDVMRGFDLNRKRKAYREQDRRAAMVAQGGGTKPGRRQFRFLWADVPSGHPGATGPASRDRVAYLLRAARSRRDTICRIHHSNGQHGYQIGALQLWEK